MKSQLATATTSSPVQSPIRVQRRASTDRAPSMLRSHPARTGRDESAAIHAAAARGIATPSSALPHAALIQRWFGHHDISSVRAHTGSVAAAAADDMRARAFASGDHVVLDHSADLRTVAHEAAHVVQQRGGVRLQGGVGTAGDVHERHADQVAAAVVQGRSAETLLDRYAGAGQTAAPAVGCIQRWPETDLEREDKRRAPDKLAYSVEFERKLGKAAYRDPRSLDAADQMIARVTEATLLESLAELDEADAEQQEKLVDLYGRDAAKGAGSAGQVGKEFATVMAALHEGNLRERMTGLYNASLSGFKTEVLRLMSEERWDEMAARGLDDEKLRRRKRQMKYTPRAKDLYRDPGNPLDRKHLSTFKWRGQTRTEAPDDEKYSKRTVGELERLGAELSDREKRFMYPDKYTGADTDLLFAVDPSDPVMWREGGTYWQVNPDNKWVRKCQDKLHMPVTAGPSGTTLRMFQAWEWVGKPTRADYFRLALLGWMMTSNDHSFHEIMMTAAEYGLPYTPGLDAYRNVEPFTAEELRAIAGPKGFPDEQNYWDDHMDLSKQNSVFTTPQQLARFANVIRSGSDIWVSGALPDPGRLAQAMAVLVYTDESTLGPGGNPIGVSAYKFINNVLKGHDNLFVMHWFLARDPGLKAAFDANKFNIKQLIGEARQHARFMEAGLRLLKPFTGRVYRGYSASKLPKAGKTWIEDKFFSMSQERHVAEGFADRGSGRYHILVTMDSVTGRDLGNLSMLGATEREVVFPPGSQFTVAAPPTPWPGKGENYYEVTWVNL